MKQYYDTEMIEINGLKYCAYCCKEAIRDIRYGSYHNNIDDEIYYHCDCADAQKEIELQIREIKMQEEIEKALRNSRMELQKKIYDNKPNIRKLEYEIKLNQLNKQYSDVVITNENFDEEMGEA
jgi:hypothetical protein